MVNHDKNIAARNVTPKRDAKFMTLRAIAIASPQFEEGRAGQAVLSSVEPASLFNACRHAASLADECRGPWGDSNWAVARTERRELFLLMHSWEQGREAFQALIDRVRPNLILLGAMTICMPGAIACANHARRMLGPDVCIVLGGWHASESIWVDQSGSVRHHASSPIRLMAEGVIPDVFDLVISGDAEHLVTWIGERISSLESSHVSPRNIFQHLEGLGVVRGNWLLSWIEGDSPRTVVGRAGQVDRSANSSPARRFGVGGSFDIYPGRLTSHAFSDSGRGCVFDCSFCSERRSNTGPLSEVRQSSDRLFHQFRETVDVIANDSPQYGASAFVEDSTLLAGSRKSMLRLAHLLGAARMDFKFGGQLTIDQILGRKAELQALSSVGLDYLFIGVETPVPQLIGGLSKDVGAKEPWLSRTERAIELLRSIEIRCGCALLFGLGEEPSAREKLLEQVAKWRARYGSPSPVSMNWAVQHPLKGEDGGTAYQYLQWAVPRGSWTQAFANFGEASVIYPIAGQPQPHLSEVQDLVAKMTMEDLLVPPHQHPPSYCEHRN
jgi:B12-binding domain/radical SAM domain protein